MDVIGFNVVAATPIVIESFGSTSLVEVGNNYFLYPVGGSSGPELKYMGANVTAGQFGGWTPIGVEVTAGRLRGCRGIWQASISIRPGTPTAAATTFKYHRTLSGNSCALVSLETSFQQDLNGDGTIGSGVSPPEIAVSGNGVEHH